MQPFNVLIVDDHEAVRHHLRSLLATRSDLVVCDEAVDGVDAIEKAKSLRPDLVIMDITMPRMAGTEATRIIRRELPHTKIIVVSQNDPTVVERQAAEIGASGYVPKTDLARDLLHTIDVVIGPSNGANGSSSPAQSDDSDTTWSLFSALDLDQATNLLAAIVQSSDDAIVSKNLDGVITSWNKAAEHLFGYTEKEAVGRHITIIIPRDRLDEESRIIEHLRRGERVDHFETVRVRKDGSLRELSLTISPIKDRSGRVVGASKIARDITQQKRVEKELVVRAREQRALFHLADRLHRAQSFQGIYEAGLDAICDASQCNRAAILLVDETGSMRFVGWRGLSESYRAAVEGHSPWQKTEAYPVPVYIDDVDRADLDESLKATVKKEGIASLAFIPLVSGGQLVGKFMMYFNSPHAFTGDELDLSLTIARQIAFAVDRTRAQETLRESEERFRILSATLDAEVRARTVELEERNAELLWRSEQLRDVSRRMLQMQDSERRHIARELHDSAGQTLAVLSMIVGSLARSVRPALAKDAEDAEKLVQELSQEIRTMSYLLHPPLLDENGLAEALGWYVQGLVQRSNLDIALSVPEDFGRLSADTELVIFRLVQECLTNIHRHSGSKSASIRLSRQEPNVVLEVEDHGKGISAEKLADIRSRGSGVGIRGMTERVRQFNGEMKIESNENGTKISFILPSGSVPPPGEEEAARSFQPAS